MNHLLRILVLVITIAQADFLCGQTFSVWPGPAAAALHEGSRPKNKTQECAQTEKYIS